MRPPIFIVFSIILLALLSCKKVQPELKELDCGCAHEVSADFTMEERGAISGQSPDNYLTLTDTIFKNRLVKFMAKEIDAEYTWYVGSEVLHTKTFERNFPDTWAGQNIPITLVVKKKPNRICFPNEDGYDSITKILHVSHYIETLPDDYVLGTIEGVYRFKSEHLPDSFDVKFYGSRNNLNFGSILLNLENYDGMGSNLNDYPIINALNYKQVFFDEPDEIIQGSLHNLMNGKSEMNFIFINTSVPGWIKQSYKYRGRRISNL